MSIYYNDTDPFCAAWLRALMDAGLIPAGDIDTRSIDDVRPDDLRPYTQCHFFAGIGGWAYALALAGWPEGREVWTGSCPCQPFSTAGRQGGFDDKRHLWPVFRRLIRERRPATVFGEQVASALGRVWLAGVRADLEDVGYAVGAGDLCAAGVGAPHVRQRIFWGAHPLDAEQSREPLGSSALDRARVGQLHLVEGLAHPLEPVRGRGWRQLHTRLAGRVVAAVASEDAIPQWNGPTFALGGADGARRASAEPGAFPLADGVPHRVGRLRGYGNAIVPSLAAEFIRAYEEARAQGGIEQEPLREAA